MARLLVFLCALAIVANVFALGQPLFQQEKAGNEVTNGLNYGAPTARDNIPRFESIESMLRRLGLRVLPMKRSIAIGRAGFRPGKRSLELLYF